MAQVVVAPRKHLLREGLLSARLRYSRKFREAAKSAAHASATSNLLSIPLTVAGFGCIDAAAFVGNLIAGLVVTGVSLVVLEHLIADED